MLISGPSKAADLTVVLGANDAELAGQQIVSNASCTTNALAPLARLIDENWGVVTGSMTTIHCYTGSQPTVDAPAADFARITCGGAVDGADDDLGAAVAGSGVAADCGADRRLGGAGADGFGFGG